MAEAYKLLISGVIKNNRRLISDAVSTGADLNEESIGDNGSPLHLAAELGHVDAADELIILGAVVDSYSKAWSCTPLSTAAWCHHCSLVKLLLAKGADPSKVDEVGNSPMHFAAENGCVECIQLLYNAGGDVNYRGENKWIPLHGAACFGNPSAVKALLERGSEINAKDESGATPLCYAIFNKHQTVINFIESSGGIY